MAMPDWLADYKRKTCTAEKAIAQLKSGRRVFIGSSCGEPQHLTNTLLDHADDFSDLELLRLLNLEGSIEALMAEETLGRRFNIRSIYQGSGNAKNLEVNRRFLTPINLFTVPSLFRQKLLPLHYALIQVSPPDVFGYMNLGISVDITLAAALSAEVVIAQVNPRMPVVAGQGFLPVDRVHAVVEKEEELLTAFELPEDPSAQAVAKMTANLIGDGSTIHLGLGTAMRAIARELENKNDLGVHTMCLTDAVMSLVQKGVVTNNRKGINERKLIASCAIGTDRLYEAMGSNPAVELHPSDYVNHPRIISQCNGMVSIQFATKMDLKGQVAADALPQNHFFGVTGMIDFVRGACLCPGGKSIMVIPSVCEDGHTSRIVPELEADAVVVPASDVSHVVSEFGAVNLFGKNIQERAMAMISLAHPEARERLFEKAKKQELIGRERSLKETLFGVYPSGMEESLVIDGVPVVIRPVKASDDRLVQEHFYNMDQEDILLRFFSFRKHFHRDEMESMFQVDYIHNLSVVALAEETGFGKIIGLGVYMLEPGKDMAEVAFSVLKDWQGKGLAKELLLRLTEAARQNGVKGFIAYVARENIRMIGLFNKLPFTVKSSLEEGELMLTCRFQE